MSQNKCLYLRDTTLEDAAKVSGRFGRIPDPWIYAGRQSAVRNRKALHDILYRNSKPSIAPSVELFSICVLV